MNLFEIGEELELIAEELRDAEGVVDGGPLEASFDSVMDARDEKIDRYCSLKPPVTEVGWRVREWFCTENQAPAFCFEITTDDGDTWTQTDSWDCPTAGDIVRAGYAVFAQYPGARVVEFEEIRGAQ